ncbi:MAG: hypothetical protein LAO20_14355 [Acidobacteriia bacterium]|nr:hypothetical protein [Terriglobia bacterium]
MSDNSKPQGIPEGEAYLFVRLNPKTGEFSCMHSNILDALALLSLATTTLEKNKRDMLGLNAPPAIAPPGMAFPDFDLLRKKQA